MTNDISSQPAIGGKTRPNVALLFAATGRYATEFASQYAATASQHFLPAATEDLFAFTDTLIANCECIDVPHERWPGPSVRRWECLLKQGAIEKSYDYLHMTDADLYFILAGKFPRNAPLHMGYAVGSMAPRDCFSEADSPQGAGQGTVKMFRNAFGYLRLFSPMHF